MKNRVVNILLLSFCLLFLIFPVSFSIPNIGKRIAVIVLIFLLFIFLSIIKKHLKFNFSSKYFLYLVFIISFISKLIVVLLFSDKIVQISDFRNAFNVASSLKFATVNFQVFTHWILYPRLMNFIFLVFGSSQFVAALVNNFILSFSAVFLYLISKKIFKNDYLSFVCTLIYILWPANIIYTLVFTQEHLCLLISLIVVYLFLNNGKRRYSRYIIMTFIGFLLGVMVFLKNFSLVFIVAFLIYYILDCMVNKTNYKKILKYISYLAVCFVCFSTTKFFIYNWFDDLVQNRVVRNITPCYLNVGLRDSGIYSVENYSMYFKSFEKNNYDYKDTNKEIMEDLIKYIKKSDSPVKTSSFWINKATKIVNGDVSRIQIFSSMLEKGGGTIRPFILNFLYKVNSFYYYLLMALSVFGLFNFYSKKNYNLFLIFLIYFGSMLMLLLVEAQNRYMYVMLPLLCIMSTSGIEYIFNNCDIFLNKISKTINCK